MPLHQFAPISFTLNEKYCHISQWLCHLSPHPPLHPTSWHCLGWTGGCLLSFQRKPRNSLTYKFFIVFQSTSLTIVATLHPETAAPVIPKPTEPFSYHSFTFPPSTPTLWLHQDSHPLAPFCSWTSTSTPDHTTQHNSSFKSLFSYNLEIFYYLAPIMPWLMEHRSQQF